MRAVDLSIIIPVYKGKRFIPGLTDMVQRNVDYAKSIKTELIFVDDYPEDPIDELNTSRYGFTISVIHNPQNLGIHGSRVRGLNEASGEYVCFLDQDDIIEDSYVKSQIRSIKDSEIVICNGIFRNDQLIYTETRKQELAFNRDHFIRTLGFIISPGQIVLKKSIIPEKWIKKPIVHNGNDDTLLWSLLVDNGCTVAVNRDVLYTHVENGENNSFRWEEMIRSKIETLQWLEDEKVFTDSERSVYRKTVEKFVEKYEAYIKCDSYLKNTQKISSRVSIRYQDKAICIYGAGVYGRKLKTLLEKNGISVLFFIDANSDAMSDDELCIYNSEDDFPYCDFMIVTPVQIYEEIKEKYYLKAGVIIRIDDFLEKLFSD